MDTCQILNKILKAENINYPRKYLKAAQLPTKTRSALSFWDVNDDACSLVCNDTVKILMLQCIDLTQNLQVIDYKATKLKAINNIKVIQTEESLKMGKQIRSNKISNLFSLLLYKAIDVF